MTKRSDHWKRVFEAYQYVYDHHTGAIYEADKNPLDVGGGGFMSEEESRAEPYEQRKKRLSVLRKKNTPTVPDPAQGPTVFQSEDIKDITDAEEYLYQQSKKPKGRPDLFPAKALQLAGQVLAFGESKHPDEKWKGMTSNDHIGACWRHMLEHQAGNTYDSESGELHLAHAFVRLGMALDRYLEFR